MALWGRFRIGYVFLYTLWFSLCVGHLFGLVEHDAVCWCVIIMHTASFGGVETSRCSPKALDPAIAILFMWAWLSHEVRIEGSVVREEPPSSHGRQNALAGAACTAAA